MGGSSEQNIMSKVFVLDRTYAKNSQTLIPLCSLRPGAVRYSVTRA
jgi:hypothetical protein